MHFILYVLVVTHRAEMSTIEDVSVPDPVMDLVMEVVLYYEVFLDIKEEVEAMVAAGGGADADAER